MNSKIVAVRMKIEYPVFKKMSQEDLTLVEIRKITSKIKTSLAKEIINEREGEWR